MGADLALSDNKSHLTTETQTPDNELYVDGANPEVIREIKRGIDEYEKSLLHGRAALVDETRRYANNTCQLSEETQRNVAVDLYINV